MNGKRSGHGIGILTLNGEDKIAIFGGRHETRRLDSVEVYDQKTQKWTKIDIKLTQAKETLDFSQ